MQPAADMAEQAGQKADHRPRHPSHLDQQAEKDEQRYRQQDQMAHAFVHAADQHHQRRVCGQRQIAEDRKPESEADWNTGKHAATGEPDKEDDQVEIAERPQPGLRQPEQRHQQENSYRRAQRQPAVAGG
jgi:hypothetical protein